MLRLAYALYIYIYICIYHSVLRSALWRRGLASRSGVKCTSSACLVFYERQISSKALSTLYPTCILRGSDL
ncbi:hypothetical protein ACSBR2_012883 [Camellia fascicularis]